MLITVALQCSLKSGPVILLALFFFLKIVLAVQDLLCGPIHILDLFVLVL